MNPLLAILYAPVSALISVGLFIRHRLYDAHILHSSSVSVPTVCVGNLALGGTGKTPHTEYLIRQLSSSYKLAVLSRGYGRRTKGFRMVTPTDTALTVGDEPLQIATKFPSIPVAVCEKRVAGVRKLIKLYPDLQLVILDDAFQHRAIRCDLNILLTAHDNLYVHDHVWPLGRLRDLKMRSHKAQVIIVTKCPEGIKPIEKRIIETSLHKLSFQQLYFSSYTYAPLPQEGTPLVVTGIANPQPFFDYVQQLCPKAELLSFPDHHLFLSFEVDKIVSKAKGFDYVLTTEKDLPRLVAAGVQEALGNRLYTLPIEVSILDEGDQLIKKISNTIDKLC